MQHPIHATTNHWGVFDNGLDRIDWILPDGKLVAINRAGQTALGRFDHDDSAAKACQSWTALWPTEAQASIEQHLATALAGQTTRFTACSQSVAGPRWWDVVLSPVDGRGVVAQARDVTDAKTSEMSFRFRSMHDSLTGLLNRSAIKEQIDVIVDATVKAGGTGAVMMIDLDNFKLINDTLGHDAGDAVLRSVAAELSAALETKGLVARLGGDEFAVVVPEIVDLESVRVIAETVLVRLAQPIDFNGRQLSARASIGVALFPKHGSGAADLLKNADIALYAAKAFGRGCYVTFVASMSAAIRRRAAAAAAVDSAITENRVDPVYQPMVELRTGRLIGFEAKLQLQLLDGRTMEAAEIAPVYDDVELAQRLGTHVLARVTNDIRTWRAAGLMTDRVAMNVAAAEFRTGDYAERFLAQLASAGLSADAIDVEIAETAFASRGTDYIVSALNRLKEAGVRVRLGAFGTGPASLSHLKCLPVSGIKIDGCFIEAVDRDTGDSAVVRAIIGLANGFGIELAADGVCTLGQAQALATLGCNVGQGALFGAARPAPDIATLLASHSPVFSLPNVPLQHGHNQAGAVQL